MRTNAKLLQKIGLRAAKLFCFLLICSNQFSIRPYFEAAKVLRFLLVCSVIRSLLKLTVHATLLIFACALMPALTQQAYRALDPREFFARARPKPPFAIACIFYNLTCSQHTEFELKFEAGLGSKPSTKPGTRPNPIASSEPNPNRGSC